ncbi:putative carbohydrate esterase [Fibrella aestuarina BUZ 2]|uniref:Putative carbohydrate esterase n=1 Tax=Fibrella aestuarina BUZ 2 TaxID=1166018 RepID=I0K9S1_9BACT|nr:sialate O-acetylesterase [Fibrella aestuarina]CCH00874.1 putative carbohydrate esterase [Fibrella aestuarina BUZ 2]
MPKSPLLLLAFLAGISQLFAQSPASAPAQPIPAKLHLYLLAGQSNMAGRGAPAETDKQPNPHILMLNQANQWVVATEPLHFDKPSVVGVGPGLAFARAMLAADTTAYIGLIPVAVGGSAIDSWQPGGYHDQTKSYPYDDALRRAKIALPSGTLRGILWHQGESDSKPELVAGYDQKLITLINRFRQELAAPNVPVVVGTLGDFYVRQNPAAAQINAQLRNLPTRLPVVACIEATGLTDKGDQTHFDTPSARELGRRYAEAMRKLQAKK